MTGHSIVANGSRKNSTSVTRIRPKNTKIKPPTLANFGHALPQNLSKSTGAGLQHRLHQKSASQTTSKVIFAAVSKNRRAPCYNLGPKEGARGTGDGEGLSTLTPSNQARKPSLAGRIKEKHEGIRSGTRGRQQISPAYVFFSPSPNTVYRRACRDTAKNDKQSMATRTN